MKIKRYGYYFKKPKSEIAKDILSLLVFGGGVAIAATSPFFIQNMLREFKRLKKYKSKKVYDTFYRLKKQGFIDFYEKNNQIFISLTKKGKRKAGWMQINDLRVNKPKKWDRKWRVIMFDIVQLKRLYREALRGKLINMGFVMLQKSVWIIPYDCAKEVELLKSFFGLSSQEIRMLVVEDIGEDKKYKKFFNLT
jgi:DNA-binding transcriptional regulator PaaX